MTPTCNHRSPCEKGRHRKATEGSGGCDDRSKCEGERRKRSGDKECREPPESRRGEETLVHVGAKSSQACRHHDPGSGKLTHNFKRIDWGVVLFCFGHQPGMWFLVPQPRIKSTSPALESRSLNHWTTGKFLDLCCHQGHTTHRKLKREIFLSGSTFFLGVGAIFLIYF